MSGLIGHGVNVLSPVDMEKNLVVGGLSNKAGNVLEVVQQANHVLLKNVQCIVSGLVGVGVDVIRAVDMESNLDIGV